jgi:MFS family permease
MKNKSFYITAVCLVTFFVLNGEAGLLDIIVLDIAQGLLVPFEANHWIITVYSLSFAAVIIAAARLGVIYGYYKVTFVGILLYTVGGIICAVSSSFIEIIVGRFLQGIGAGLCIPNITGIIFAKFGEKKGLASGIIECAISVALLIGPLYGTAVAQEFSWKYIFIIDSIITILLIFAFWKFSRAYNNPDRTQKISITAIILLFISIGTILFAFKFTFGYFQKNNFIHRHNGDTRYRGYPFLSH